MHKQQTPDKYTQSGVYKMTCPDCNKAYVGQTGRDFITRFNEHKNAFRLNHRTSNFAIHLIEELHSFGPIQNTMQIPKCYTKGTRLNTKERSYTYAECVKNNHLNDEHTITPNRIFEVLLKTPTATNPPTHPRPHPFNNGHTAPTTQMLGRAYPNEKNTTAHSKAATLHDPTHKGQRVKIFIVTKNLV
jgi:hypothetical protein